MNLPISAAAALLVLIFLDLKTPEGTLRQKLARIDFVLVSFDKLTTRTYYFVLICSG